MLAVADASDTTVLLSPRRKECEKERAFLSRAKAESLMCGRDHDQERRVEQRVLQMLQSGKTMTSILNKLNVPADQHERLLKITDPHRYAREVSHVNMFDARLEQRVLQMLHVEHRSRLDILKSLGVSKESHSWLIPQPSGLRWRDLGTKRPQTATRDLTQAYPELVQALSRRKTLNFDRAPPAWRGGGGSGSDSATTTRCELQRDEWRSIGIERLTMADFVRIGGSYYGPEEGCDDKSFARNVACVSVYEIFVLMRDETHGPQAGWRPGLFQLKLKGDPKENTVQIAHLDKPQRGHPKGDRRGGLRNGDYVLRINDEWLVDGNEDYGEWVPRFADLDAVRAFVQRQGQKLELVISRKRRGPKPEQDKAAILEDAAWWLNAQVQITTVLGSCLPTRHADRLEPWFTYEERGTDNVLARLPLLPTPPSHRGPTRYTPVVPPTCLCVYEPFLKCTTGKGFTMPEARPDDPSPGGTLTVHSWYDALYINIRGLFAINLGSSSDDALGELSERPGAITLFSRHAQHATAGVHPEARKTAYGLFGHAAEAGIHRPQGARRTDLAASLGDVRHGRQYDAAAAAGGNVLGGLGANSSLLASLAAGAGGRTGSLGLASLQAALTGSETHLWVVIHSRGAGFKFETKRKVYDAEQILINESTVLPVLPVVGDSMQVELWASDASAPLRGYQVATTAPIRVSRRSVGGEGRMHDLPNLQLLGSVGELVGYVHITRRLKTESKAGYELAGSRVQSVARGYMYRKWKLPEDRKRYRAELAKKSDAAIMLQRRWRRQASRRFNKTLERQHRYARLVQTHWRGGALRRKLRAMPDHSVWLLYKPFKVVLEADTTGRLYFPNGTVVFCPPLGNIGGAMPLRASGSVDAGCFAYIPPPTIVQVVAQRALKAVRSRKQLYPSKRVGSAKVLGLLRRTAERGTANTAAAVRSLGEHANSIHGTLNEKLERLAGQASKRTTGDDEQTPAGSEASAAEEASCTTALESSVGLPLGLGPRTVPASDSIKLDKLKAQVGQEEGPPERQALALALMQLLERRADAMRESAKLARALRLDDKTSYELSHKTDLLRRKVAEVKQATAALKAVHPLFPLLDESKEQLRPAAVELDRLEQQWRALQKQRELREQREARFTQVRSKPPWSSKVGPHCKATDDLAWEVLKMRVPIPMSAFSDTRIASHSEARLVILYETFWSEGISYPGGQLLLECHSSAAMIVWMQFLATSMKITKTQLEDLAKKWQQIAQPRIKERLRREYEARQAKNAAEQRAKAAREAARAKAKEDERRELERRRASKDKPRSSSQAELKTPRNATWKRLGGLPAIFRSSRSGRRQPKPGESELVSSVGSSDSSTRPSGSGRVSSEFGTRSRLAARRPVMLEQTRRPMTTRSMASTASSSSTPRQQQEDSSSTDSEMTPRGRGDSEASLSPQRPLVESMEEAWNSSPMRRLYEFRRATVTTAKKALENVREKMEIAPPEAPDV